MVRHRGTGELIPHGCVYVLQNDLLGADVFKIGMSTGDVEKRAGLIGKQFKIAGGLKVLFAQPTRDAYQLETRVHLKLRPNRLAPDHPISVKFGLGKSREFFHGLTLKKAQGVITRSVKGLEIEDSWCKRLRENPQLISEINGVSNKLSPENPDVLYWVDKLTANGGQPVAEFTFKQIAKGVKHTPRKTSYLTWSFEGKARAWFDPTYPRAASTLIHRRFDGDWQKWEDLLGKDAVFYEYRDGTEIRLTLWTPEHMDAMRTMVEEVMPKVHFQT